MWAEWRIVMQRCCCRQRSGSRHRVTAKAQTHAVVVAGSMWRIQLLIKALINKLVAYLFIYRIYCAVDCCCGWLALPPQALVVGGRTTLRQRAIIR